MNDAVVEAMAPGMPVAVLDANQLARNRTEMGFDRTILAFERTMMAWIRTSLSLIGFGFTIFKFLETMQKTDGSTVREHAPRNLGFFLIFVGMGTLILAIFQYKKAMVQLQAFSETKPPVSVSLTAAIGVLLVGVAMLVNMFGLWGF